jgi:hypothetical protein
LSRLIIGDPLVIYSERRQEALTAIWKDGFYGEGVIQSAIAAEVLLDSILALVLWESKTSIEEAAGIFPETSPLESRTSTTSAWAALGLSQPSHSRVGSTISPICAIE